MEPYEVLCEDLSRDFIAGLSHGMTETASLFEKHPGEFWSSEQVAEILRRSALSAAVILEEFMT